MVIEYHGSCFVCGLCWGLCCGAKYGLYARQFLRLLLEYENDTSMWFTSYSMSWSVHLFQC